VSVADLLPLVAQYRAGLETEMALLQRLRTLSARQREVAASSNELSVLHEIGDERESVMASLVTIESELKPVRDAIVAGRDRLAGVPEFLEVAALHESAAQMVSDILTADEHSLQALKDAELTRRFTAQAIDKGESTLAAYRRVLTPKLAQATLVNRKG
jgi:uncharacterized protein YhaN